MFKKYRTHILSVCGVIAALGGAFVGAQSLGLELPRPAWSTEVAANTKKLHNLNVRTFQMIKQSIQRQYWTLQNRLEDKQDKGRSLSRSDREQLKRLKSNLDEAVKRLKSKRGY